MNSRLEQFINDHREEFDGEEPDNKVWEKIRKQVVPEKKKQAPLVRLYRVRWSAAAAVVLLMAGAAWYINAHRGNGQSTDPVIASKIRTLRRHRTHPTWQPSPPTRRPPV